MNTAKRQSGCGACSQWCAYRFCDARRSISAELRQMMMEADAVLRLGIEAMVGLPAFHVGEDEVTFSLSNVSLWTSLEAAKQLDTFQPMPDLGKPFIAKNAAFARPIMNYVTLWQLNSSAVSGDTAP
jgi:hypothetical protein